MDKSNWVISKQSGIMVNLNNIADILVKGGTVMAYTPSGYGIMVFRGTDDECVRVRDLIRNQIGAVEV